MLMIEYVTSGHITDRKKFQYERKRAETYLCWWHSSPVQPERMINYEFHNILIFSLFVCDSVVG